MNLPNKLTILRVIMIPFFVVFMYLDFAAAKWIALGIFIAAAITDTLDGQIARRCNLVTTFGKFMDPLADKLLVCSAMIALVDQGRIPAWIVIIIIAREFIISGFRLIAAEKGVVIAAGIWGKLKTVVQMVMVCFLQLVFNNDFTLRSGFRSKNIYVKIAYSGFGFFYSNINAKSIRQQRDIIIL